MKQHPWNNIETCFLFEVVRYCWLFFFSFIFSLCSSEPGGNKNVVWKLFWRIVCKIVILFIQILLWAPSNSLPQRQGYGFAAYSQCIKWPENHHKHSFNYFDQAEAGLITQRIYVSYKRNDTLLVLIKWKCTLPPAIQ